MTPNSGRDVAIKGFGAAVHRIAFLYARLLLRLVRLATPSRFATDASAIVLPADECPFRSSLLASLSSLDVGGVIVSLLLAIDSPL